MLQLPESMRKPPVKDRPTRGPNVGEGKPQLRLCADLGVLGFLVLGFEGLCIFGFEV